MLRMHQDAFDLVAQGVLWVDAAGRVRHANEFAATQLGYSLNQLTSASYFEIDPHFSLLAWKRFWNRLLEHQSERMETEFVNHDGKLFSVKGYAGFDLFATDPELCIIVFSSAEEGKRDLDLLEAVQREAEVGAWEYNLTTGRVYLSKPVRQWLGLSLDVDYYSVLDFVNLFRNRIPTEKKEEIKRLIGELRRSAKYREYDLQLLPNEAAGPSPGNFSLTAESAENELEVYKVFGTLRPRQAQNARTNDVAGDGLFRYAIDRHNTAVLVADRESGNLVYANAHTGQLSGYALRELEKITIDSILPDFERDKLTGNYTEVRTRMLRRDGNDISVSVQVHRLESEEGDTLVLFLTDERAADGKAEDLQLYITTLNILREWVIWLDADHKIVLLNDAARRKLGRRTSLPLDGMPLGELMPELSIPQLSEIRAEQLDGRHRAAVDYIFTNPSGGDRQLQINFSQVAAGSRLFLCMICRDVTREYVNKQKLLKTKNRVKELSEKLKSENEALKEQIDQVNISGPIITVSKKYQQILSQIAQVADTDATVLITGETGTGKELLAQSIHKFSGRSNKQLVSVNCAALPDNLIESELFGHERGAFTGAFAQKKGKFELAQGGTIFLDEIGELPLDMQAKLLRALQEGEVQRIGSTEVINVDVRVVAATNRDLERMISEGDFREDLYYRLNVFPIHNLPLRERPEDIPVLVKHFAKVYAERMGRHITQIRPADIEKLVAYDFPGNVRELINLVERAVITSPDSTLNLGASLQVLRRSRNKEEGLNFRGDRIIAFEEMQRQYIIETLKRTNGKVTGPGGAAELLDLNGRTLMSKMNKLGINRNNYTK